MPDTFRRILISFILISICGVAVIGFVAEVQEDNHANASILDNPFINKTFFNLGGNITEGTNTAEAQREAINREQVEIPEGSFLLVSVIGTAAKFGDIIVGVYNLTLGLIFEFIGFGSKVFGALVTVFLAAVIFAGWKTFKTGT